jgi:formylglycine-generating enzyme required for sulfatase activity
MTYSSASAPEMSSPGMTPELQVFQERFGDPHLYLAYHAAFPIALTPHLLYRLWANFQADMQGQALQIPWIAVADLLLSPICHEVGYELYEMEQHTRNQLLEQLTDHPGLGQQRLQELAHFLLAYIQQQLKSPRATVRDFALAQRWTALAYLHPEAAAHELALQLAQLSLADKTEWLWLASLAETLADPLRKGNFEPLLIYLQGMRSLARDDDSRAAAQFQTLPTHNHRMVVAGVTLPIPEFRQSVWRISAVQAAPPTFRSLEFKTAELIRQPRFLRLGSKWRVCRQEGQAESFDEPLGEGVVLEMVHIPAGQFRMGAAEKEGDDRERPQHLVTLDAFCLSAFPVTQAQWQVVAKQNKVRIDLHPELSRFKGANLPVEQVTWFGAIEFCERLQLLTGRPYRLPSEAEWEYACRAGTTTPFYFGKTLSPEVATYDSQQRYRSGPKSKASKQTSNVGCYQAANAFGLEDLHGNVWEWCADHWYEDYTDAPADGEARVTDSRSSHRIIRGGSWMHGPSECRSAYRNDVPPDYRVLTIGFRVAVSL